MAGVRENILTSANARDQFLTGCVALDQEMPDVSAQAVFTFLQNNNIPLPMSGINQQLSTYDLFVLWHVVAMSIPLPPGNAAHSGPIFLPWHRMYLISLEENLQRVLGDPDFGLPYWDWGEDGELQTPTQWQSALWGSNVLGNSRGTVQAGPLEPMRVRLEQDSVSGDLLSVSPRRLRRRAGLNTNHRDLPDHDDVRTALLETDYDRPNWNRIVRSHRNVLEGWWNPPMVPGRARLHNRVHVWIGGDMGPGTSPNDPVFFLNHCNVDRIWESWMAIHGQNYRPAADEGNTGHRINDLMVNILGQGQRPSDVLDPTQWYSYDALVSL